MKKILNIAAIVLLAIFMTSEASAEKFKGPKAQKKSSTSVKRVGAAQCLPAKSSTDLDLNNVRARINTGGDMWWDLQGQPEYEIPKGSKKTAMFSASLWMGGVDANGQLKGAFQRYRGNGNDFWTGPLTNDNTASVTADVCAEYDRHYVILRSQVDEFRAKYNNSDYPDYVVPDIIKEWPAHPTFPDQSYYLAPFFDNDGDGEYDYTQGDYPYYDVENALCKPTKNASGVYEYTPTAEGNGILADQVLKGDQTLWWVFNDKGNFHSETQGNPIGVEIRAQAFAFTTNDVINNMTFYTYEIINRSTFTLYETYFSQWVDTDLGDATDDYVGCDVERGLGYCYNGDNVDGNGLPTHYGEQPPAVGVDFFQGPYMDPDGIDNPKISPYAIYNIDTNVTPHDTISIDTIMKANCDESINGVNFGDSIVDNERFGMRRFVYHNNTGGSSGAYMTDPELAPDYYNFLKGIWKDGTKMRYGGGAHLSTGGSGPECDFMFPADTDPCNWGTGGQPTGMGLWTEETAGNQPYDRRFMQSAGPFRLDPGAVNYITVGIPWARAATGGAFASVELLRTVDDKCQALFDNCFKVLDGPDAPELTIQELNREIVLYIENVEGSNNFNEMYDEIDPTISALNPDTLPAADRYDSLYRFQGYQIFQLVDDEASIADIYDVSKSRLVAQCDIKDDVDMIVNYVKDEKVGSMVPNIMVEGENEGIRHSFRITEDKFATGDNRLINHKKYYYVAIAYGYNEFLKYSDDPSVIGGLYGQKTPYLAGRKSALGPIKVMTAIPHITSPEAEGTSIIADYGDGPQITRLAGKGNGGYELQLSDESIDEIMAITEEQIAAGAKARIENPVYQKGNGPIQVTVVDPLNVQPGEYDLYFNMDTTTDINNASWVLYLNGDSLMASDRTITVANEQLMLEYGIAITIGQVNEPGQIDEGLGYITSDIKYEDSTSIWLRHVPDYDNGLNAFNWIRSGSLDDANDDANSDYKIGDNFIDPDEAFEKVENGIFAPFRMVSRFTDGPGPASNVMFNKTLLSYLNSVVIVYTPDKTKWTRCAVIEMGEDRNVNEGGTPKWDLRSGYSIDKEGNFATPGAGVSTNPNDPHYQGETGMGWFPGYAIDLESGERLNMLYGEDSWLVGDNGRDMQFNPTANVTGPLGQTIFGGKHFLYVVRHAYEQTDVAAYDGGKSIREFLASNPSQPSMIKFYSSLSWVSIPIAHPDEEWLNNEVRITINVQKPYSRYSWAEDASTTPVNDEYPAYRFNTGELATQKAVATVAEDALDLIAVVPNPYQAFSSYEESQLDNRVKIVNLPERCTIKIYNAGGTLVRTISKDNDMTSVEWDLKNHADIPIASGVYYIHVDAEGIGEKVVKWFGVLRPTDLNAF